jgi:hypothetical protein
VNKNIASSNGVPGTHRYRNRFFIRDKPELLRFINRKGHNDSEAPINAAVESATSIDEMLQNQQDELKRLRQALDEFQTENKRLRLLCGVAQAQRSFAADSKYSAPMPQSEFLTLDWSSSETSDEEGTQMDPVSWLQTSFEDCPIEL